VKRIGNSSAQEETRNIPETTIYEKPTKIHCKANFPPVDMMKDKVVGWPKPEFQSPSGYRPVDVSHFAVGAFWGFQMTMSPSNHSLSLNEILAALGYFYSVRQELKQTQPPPGTYRFYFIVPFDIDD
jgi:hypothetical protein